ncbi:hypothetical protein C8Q74DRAFT_1372185 [Fomes fomentarius]|nr:hypothetical protein C8Q74DRAFT_1372185 [Fomes fomentarius]
MGTVTVDRYRDMLSCFTIGAIISAAIDGITLLQVYIYYKRYPEDGRWLRILVGIVIVCDTASSALVTSSFYKYAVIEFGNTEHTFAMEPSLMAENTITLVIGCITQCFYARRLWAVAKNKILIGMLLFLAFGGLGTGLAQSIYILCGSTVLSLSTVFFDVVSAISISMSALCDLIAAGALCYYLRNERSSFASTNNIIDRLIVYAIQCGGLTACVGISVAAPTDWYYLPFQVIQGKLYCNTLLVTLNVRHSLRKVVDASEQLEPKSSFFAFVPGSHSTESSTTVTNGMREVSFVPGQHFTFLPLTNRHRLLGLGSKKKGSNNYLTVGGYAGDWQEAADLDKSVVYDV